MSHPQPRWTRRESHSGLVLSENLQPRVPHPQPPQERVSHREGSPWLQATEGLWGPEPHTWGGLPLPGLNTLSCRSEAPGVSC